MEIPVTKSRDLDVCTGKDQNARTVPKGTTRDQVNAIETYRIVKVTQTMGIAKNAKKIMNRSMVCVQDKSIFQCAPTVN